MDARAENRKVRPETVAIQREILSRLEQSEFALLVDYRGLTVEQIADFRRRLRGNKASFHVAKNSFLNRAVGALQWEAADDALAGPTAMIVGSGEIADVSKTLRDFARESKKATVKGGWMSGKALSAADIVSLADIPSREILYAMLAGTLAAPMSRLAGVFRQKTASLLYVLKAAETKKSESE